MNKRLITLLCTLAAAACTNSPDGTSARSPTAGSAAGTASDARVGVAPAEPVAAKEGTGVGATGTAADKEAMGPSPAGAAPRVIDDPGVADQTKNADNTKINERDRHGTLTPMDQGGSGDERRITASIRREIMGDKTVSLTGKNVKVITVGSKVTLRGPVKSDQGKSAIGAIASRTAGVSEVDNQLEVKK